MVCFCYFYQKKLSFVLDVAHAAPFLHKLDPKVAIFRGFINFFQNFWILIESILLILIESPYVFNYGNQLQKEIKVGVVLGENICATLGPML